LNEEQLNDLKMAHQVRISLFFVLFHA